jgi:3-oxoacyl-[acyl-carrier protein] reductase
MDNSFLNKTKDELMRELEVNLVGTFLCNQIYSRYIYNGLIINMASTDGIDTYSEYSMGYSVSKSGIICLSKMLANFSTLKILCVSPNWVETSSTIRMNHEYLHDELERIGQSRLIRMDELVCGIDKILNSDFESGDNFRIDIKGDKLWVEKI